MNLGAGADQRFGARIRASEAEHLTSGYGSHKTESVSALHKITGDVLRL